MTYTINNKDYTEFDINKTIAQVLHNGSSVIRSIKGADMVTVEGKGFAKIMLDYYNNPSDTWTIIEMCWDELMELVDFLGGQIICSDDISCTKWEYIMQKHNCTKLIAACICFIEMNEV